MVLLNLISVYELTFATDAALTAPQLYLSARLHVMNASHIRRSKFTEERNSFPKPQYFSIESSHYKAGTYFELCL